SATAVLISNAVEAAVPSANSRKNAADTVATTAPIHPPLSKAQGICLLPTALRAMRRAQKSRGYPPGALGRDIRLPRRTLRCERQQLLLHESIESEFENPSCALSSQ